MNTVSIAWIVCAMSSAAEPVDLRVAAIGDVNGDGVPDFAVADPGSGTPLWEGGTDRGRVWMLSGKTFDVLHEMEGESVGDRFGGALASVGDIDGDGAPTSPSARPGSGCARTPKAMPM